MIKDNMIGAFEVLLNVAKAEGNVNFIAMCEDHITIKSKREDGKNVCINLVVSEDKNESC